MPGEATNSLIVCPICDLLQGKASLPKGGKALCGRCGTTLYKSVSSSMFKTLSYTFAAAVMLIPANIYPIMTITRLGRGNEATLLESIELLFEEGSWIIGSLIFFASVFTPIAKILGLFYLSLTVKSAKHQKRKTEIYHVIEYVGRWSMIDVFLIAILVGVVKIEDIANVTVGIGAAAFSLVVVFTILAAHSFDPRVIWHCEDQEVKEIYNHEGSTR